MEKKKRIFYFCTLRSVLCEKRERERRKSARVRETEREESAILRAVYLCILL